MSPEHLLNIDRRRPKPKRDAVGEWLKILVPILIGWLLSYYTAQATASAEVTTRLAVVENTENLHFQEIQRGLADIKAWMARWEENQRQQKKELP